MTIGHRLNYYGIGLYFITVILICTIANAYILTCGVP